MAVSNSLQTQNKLRLSEYLSQDKIKKSLALNAGSKEDAQKVVSNILSVATVNPAIQECDYTSVVSGALTAHALKLSLSPTIGHCYLLPFKDKKSNIKKASFVMGYKGYIQLAMRSGYYKKMNAFAIKEGELIKYDPFEEVIELEYIQDETEREKKPTIGYYAFFEYLNGFTKKIYWTKEKMIAHANEFAPAFNAKDYARYTKGEIPKNELWQYSSFWYRNFDEMGCKTMLRQLISKWGIMSIEMQQAFEAEPEIEKKDQDFTPEDFFNISAESTTEITEEQLEIK